MSRITPVVFDHVSNACRRFFRDVKGFREVHPQSQLDILTACEDPNNIRTFVMNGCIWPLRQTGQMVLEHEMLRDPDAPGYFCVTTSYRDEPNPIEGRHKIVFPMFEFETHGGMEEMMVLQRELLEYLGYGPASSFPEGDFDDVAVELGKPGTDDINANDEMELRRRYGEVFFLKNFPNSTSPFWNMQQHDRDDPKYPDHAKKVDIIMSGHETIGSAERSCDPDEMRHQFYTISDGGYANKIFKEFTRSRVEEELEEFLALPFFKRSGGGIGMTRLADSMVQNNLVPGARVSEE